jgi:hypothetical protein
MIPPVDVTWLGIFRHIKRIKRINALFTHVQQLLTAVDALGSPAMHPESG